MNKLCCIFKNSDAIKAATQLGVHGFQDEQATWCNIYSKASDIYATACSMFEIEFYGDHLLKYKNIPNQVPFQEYVMVCRFGKLCQRDALKYYGGSPGIGSMKICSSNGDQAPRTSLQKFAEKSAIGNILKQMIEPDRLQRPFAQDILQDDSLKSFLSELGCNEQNVDNCKST